MKAGQTNKNVGQKVKIVNIRGEDSILNGITGQITHPFAFGQTTKGWVGIRIDEEFINSCPLGDMFNIHESEFEEI